MATKKRCSFMIDRDVLQQLRDIQARTGVSTAEQIREGIRWWLKARQWPEADTSGERRAGGSAGPDLA
jgi:ribbon-helix-helix protein